VFTAVDLNADVGVINSFSRRQSIEVSEMSNVRRAGLIWWSKSFPMELSTQLIKVQNIVIEKYVGIDPRY